MTIDKDTSLQIAALESLGYEVLERGDFIRASSMPVMMDFLNDAKHHGSNYVAWEPSFERVTVSGKSVEEVADIAINKALHDIEQIDYEGPSDLTTKNYIQMLHKFAFKIETLESFVNNAPAAIIKEATENNLQHAFVIWDPKDGVNGYLTSGDSLSVLVKDAVEYLLIDTEMVDPGQAKTGHPVKGEILKALQEMEEMGGPESEEYISIIEELEVELRRRKLTVAKNYLDEHLIEVDPEVGVMDSYKAFINRSDDEPVYADDHGPR